MFDRPNNLATARARQALRVSGLPFDGDLAPAPSTRNEVFLSDEFAVRINRHPNQRLRREAQLYRSLPTASWAPTAISHGGEVGSDYLIVARRAGENLSRAWPTMDR